MLNLYTVSPLLVHLVKISLTSVSGAVANGSDGTGFDSRSGCCNDSNSDELNLKRLLCLREVGHS